MKIGLVGYIMCLFLSVSWQINAQDRLTFYQKPFRQGTGFGVRAGFTYSIPTVTAYQDNNSPIISILWGIRPKVGFYLGSSYYTDLLPNRLSLRIDGTLALKQTGAVDMAGKLVLTSRYEYVSVNPLLGLQLARRLLVYSGVEVSLLIARQNSWGKSNPLDLGPTLRLAYQFGSLGIELGYYRGFLPYDQAQLNIIGGPSVHDFYNQSVEAGFIYSWH